MIRFYIYFTKYYYVTLMIFAVSLIRTSVIIILIVNKSYIYIDYINISYTNLLIYIHGK